MSENNEPNCLKNRISIKRVLLDSAELLSTSIREVIDGNNDVNLILLISGGIIIGKPVLSEEYFTKDIMTPNGEPNGYKVNLFSLGDMRDKQLQEWEKENQKLEAIDNGSYICLRDATYKSGNDSYNFPELIVFVDQIQGVALSDHNPLVS